jgi:type VI secretion system secreted protein VgrG
MRTFTFPVLLLPLVLSLFAAGAHAGTIDGFAVLGASTVTNTGPTTINGNVGLSPGSSITGFGTVTLTGVEDIDNMPAINGQVDATTFYNTDTAPSFLAGAVNLTGDDLGSFGSGGLAPGVYDFSSSAQLTGALLLNTEGSDTASWTFVMGSTLTTASGSSVAIIDTGSGAYTGSIDWVVGSSTTLGTGTAFLGTIVSDASDTLNTGATDGCGGVFALTGAVTLDNNTISTACSITGTGKPGGPPVTPVPEPGTIALLSCGVLGMGFLTIHKSRTRRHSPTAPSIQ